MILINGESSRHIDIADRGFQYGDGLFETIEVIDKQPVFFDQHLKRLETGCHRLCIPFPGQTLFISEVQKLCQRAPQSNKAVLKLIVTRGVGGRGYRLPELIAPTRVLSLHPFPDYPDTYSEQGIVARFCTTRLGLNPTLAGIKHLNRLEQVMARAEWNDTSIQEGIMLDVNDQVIEGTMTNLFYIKDKTLFTAPLNQSGVAGIIRKLIIENAHLSGLTCIEHAFTKNNLCAADEAFVCNSIIGLWPIKQIESHPLQVGPKTKRLQSWLMQLKHEHCINE